VWPGVLNKKIRVLVFVNSFRIGGSERQAIEMVKRELKRHLILVYSWAVLVGAYVLHSKPGNLNWLAIFEKAVV
jgi:hypothetical protein